MHALAEQPWFFAAGIGYGGAAALYGASWRTARAFVGRAATAALCVAAAANGVAIGGRWLDADRPPFRTLFESLLLLAFTVACVYLAMERLHRTRAFGVFAALTSFGTLTYALARWDAEIVRLPPALQSPWFVPHVVVYFIGYAALAFAAAAAAVQLLAPRWKPVARVARVKLASGFTAPADLERITDDAVRFGFVMLTLGLFTGAIWARTAWGDFWAWDPKESWSLVCWLTYSAYLHLRHVHRWRGERGAWLAIAGFAIVLFTYLGVDVLPSAEESLHVYTRVPTP